MRLDAEAGKPAPMPADGIHVPYNRDLRGLEDLLSAVRRPGDFFVEASFEVPMPRLEVDGVGALSFPVPETQIRQVIAHASRAPYGRGEKTILDESVRRVWQLPPTAVRLGGKSWGKTFAQILARVAEGLGCADTPISAELYKLLVYDKGGFFAAHRDTEKALRMFATLIVVLPSAHRGGDLVIRHAGRETTLDLSDGEGSELRVAAFYADCEHEVLPVTSGHRVCLVYNLLQSPSTNGRLPLAAPPAGDQAQQAAGMLREAFAGKNAPAKLAWLFNHAYSPAGLSFAALKGEDAALARVLRRAAEAADCAVHLGIVHIEEYGAAQEKYDISGGYWGHQEEDDEEEDDDDDDDDDDEDEGDNDGGKEADDDDFEVIEVCDGSQYIAEWRDAEDRPVAFGKLPLEDGELLPAGALDGEKPDKQRLTEATGNEGASFERGYRRAALVLWPRDRFADVLLQAGVAAVLPHLAEQIAAAGRTAALRKPVVTLARRVIKAWESSTDDGEFSSSGEAPDRSTMLGLLVRLGERALLERFVGGVVTLEFDGSETAALAAAATHLPPPAVASLFAGFARENTPRYACETIHLLAAIIKRLPDPREVAWDKALTAMGGALVAELSALKPPPPKPTSSEFWSRQSAFERMTEEEAEREDQGCGPIKRPPREVDAAVVMDLCSALRSIRADALRTAAATAISANPGAFDPVKVVAPALTAIFAAGAALDADESRLWTRAAEFLLARSEHPPTPPRDWKQATKFACATDDERQLQAFVNDPAAQVYRFRVKKERRQQLHRFIERLGLDMTHTTDRQGSPQTLVCTKTLRTFERQCAQHHADAGAMSALLQSPPPTSPESARLALRLAAATKQFPAKPKL